MLCQQRIHLSFQNIGRLALASKTSVVWPWMKANRPMSQDVRLSNLLDPKCCPCYSLTFAQPSIVRDRNFIPPNLRHATAMMMDPPTVLTPLKPRCKSMEDTQLGPKCLPSLDVWRCLKMSDVWNSMSLDVTGANGAEIGFMLVRSGGISHSFALIQGLAMRHTKKFLASWGIVPVKPLSKEHQGLGSWKFWRKHKKTTSAWQRCRFGRWVLCFWPRLMGQDVKPCCQSHHGVWECGIWISCTKGMWSKEPSRSLRTSFSLAFSCLDDRANSRETHKVSQKFPECLLTSLNWAWDVYLRTLFDRLS